MRTDSPTAAGMVASRLREFIVSGRLPSGTELPRQEAMLAEFGVGSDSLRAALRMLEAEGLVTVRRGKRGGAVVHQPRPEHVARAIGLVLQALGTGVDDVASALHQLEPTCAALCAQRPDRHEAVLPVLEQLNLEAAGALEEPIRFIEVTRQFHEAIARLCGNTTLALVAGALEELWADQSLHWARTSPDDKGNVPAPDLRESLDSHYKIAAAIASGDVARVRKLCSRHMEVTREYWLEGEHPPSVNVTQQAPLHIGPLAE